MKLFLAVVACLFLPLEAVAAVEPGAHSGWISVAPPLTAILLALMFKRVIPALFAGLWVGAAAISGNGLNGIWQGLLDTYQVYVLNAFANPDHAAVILFSLMICGMVGIVSRNGGMQGIVNHIVRWADSARHATMATTVMGFAIFFDDYANTLVVGNTMRPVTDKLKVSREKLAYLVDSTAAPIASLALVTTWIGYEVGLIGDAVSGIDGYSESAYVIFLHSIAYSFYPLLALLFVVMIAFGTRDFGPMYAAEVKARQRSDDHSDHAKADAAAELITPKSGKPHRAINAIVPVAVLVITVAVGLWVTGKAAGGETLRDIIGSADAYKSLMWASLLSAITAALMSLVQGILDLEQVIDAWYRGLEAMLYACIILLLAWALGETTELLGTANYLMSLIGEGFNPGWLPAMVFVTAAATAFATGSSWGTMGILMPLVIPLTWSVLQQDPATVADSMHIMYSATASVLCGAVWGDHCSPISDTTILSSLASGCDHIEHVRTQLPYALVVGVVAILLGSLPVAFGMSWWLGLVLGGTLLVLILRLFGKKVPEPS
jgi:Na+/H+ antiporter NhaC